MAREKCIGYQSPCCCNSSAGKLHFISYFTQQVSGTTAVPDKEKFHTYGAV